MLHTELLLGRFRLEGVVATVAGGELIRARSGDGEEVLLHLFSCHEEATREAERLTELVTLGIPAPGELQVGDRGAAAVVLPGLAGAQPIAAHPRVPPPMLRPALGRLLSALSHAHSRGFVHGAVTPDSVLVTPDGGFWIAGWGGARPVRDCEEEAPRRAGIAHDLRDLGRAFAGLLGPHGAEGEPPAGQGVSPDLARIVEHLAAQDVREEYRNAAEVLADLGLPDESISDAWDSVPHVGRPAPVERVLRLLDDVDKPYDEDVMHAASVDLVGPAGSGKSRLLREVADAARARGALVLAARGDGEPGWGGVGALLRQVMRLIPPGLAADDRGLAELTEILDRSPTPQSRATLVDERSAGALSEAATSAATGMVRTVFEKRLGVLLLDDADRANPSAMGLWRALGRFVHAMNDSGAAIRVVLVTTTRAAPEAPEPGVVRERFDLEDWSIPEVSQFLGQVLVRADLEPLFAERVHRDLGGRPGDVVAFLRDLESEGALAREGVRWRICRPPKEPAAWAASGQREVLRAAMERCGADGRALLEVVAVAGDTAPSRERCATLAGVSGPRLHKGADAAIREGLLVRDGATWRPRSESIRLRILAAMPHGRRSTLHREFFVQLQALPDSAPERVAPHARGCVDPAASDWTHRAIAALRDRRRFEEAIHHLEDARTHLHADPYWTLEGRLLLADLLRLSGRLGHAIREYETYVADPRAAPTPSARACLSLAESLYEAREWDRVLAIPLPIEGGTPQTLCHIRLLRAGAHCRMRAMGRFARESRLADAELGDLEATSPIRLARIEADYLSCMARADLDGAAAALRVAIVHSMRQGQAVTRGALLGHYANLARVMHRRRHAEAIIAVSDRVLRRAGAVALPRHSRNQVTRALLLVATGDHASALDCLEAGRLMALRAGATTVASLIALRACNASFPVGKVGVVRLREYVAATQAVPGWSMGTCVEAGFVMCDLNARFSNLSAAITFDEVLSMDAQVAHKRRTVAVRLLLELWRFAKAPPTDAAQGRRAAQRLEALFEPADRTGRRTSFVIHGSGLSVAARMIRAGQWEGHPAWPSEWTLEALVEAMRSPVLGWAGVDLALALALWAPLEFDEALWEELLSVVRTTHELPWALDWQAHFVEATDARLRGDLRGSREAALDARRSFETLQRLDPGVPEERREFAGLRGRFSVPVAGESELLFSVPRMAETARGEGEGALRAAWEEPLASVPEHGNCTLLSESIRELELFLDVADLGKGLVKMSCSADVRHAACQSPAVVALMAPNLWPAPQLREALAVIRAWGHASPRVITCITENRLQFSTKSAEHRALSELAAGPPIRVHPLFQACELRSQLVAALAWRQAGVSFAPPALAMLAADARWLGARELERVIATCASANAGSGVMGIATLSRAGYRRPPTATDAFGAQLVQLVRLSSDGCAVADLTRQTGASRRTTQRRLRGLVASNQLVRVGAGRASRYVVASRSAAALGCELKLPAQ